MDEYWQDLLAFMRENEVLIEIILFFLAFAESIVVASAFVPASVIFVAVGALEGAAGGPLLPLVIAGALGAFAGDLTSLAIGHYFRNDLRKMWPLRDHPRLLARARAFFWRWGIYAVIFSKLSGPFRPILPLIAGASRMSWPLFMAASALSSVIWSVLLLVPAYLGFQAMM